MRTQRQKLLGSRNPRIALLGALPALLLALAPSEAAAQFADENLPIYTSPIDITGLPLVLRARIPDRETGVATDVGLPPGLIGPQLDALLSTPLSSVMDHYWTTPGPPNNLSPQQTACEGITQEVVKQVAALGSSYSAYDISCDLVSTGALLVRQFGSTLELAYQLSGNAVSFASTSPDTCAAGHGSPFCLNDPRFTVHFAVQLVLEMRTPSLCELVADPSGTVYVVGASIEANNAAADIAKFFGGQKFVAAEVAITDTVRQQPLPLAGALEELRGSDACTGRIPELSRALSGFRDFETEIDVREGIILRTIHVGITPPALLVPDAQAFGAAEPPAPEFPSFYRPMISTSQPLVVAGSSLVVNGNYFPLNADYTNALPVSIEHGGYGPNSIVLGGLCFQGATELEWGPLGGAQELMSFPGAESGMCLPEYAATNLPPDTAYEFRARDCDAITCSPWSATVRGSTATLDPERGAVALTLDGVTPIGTAIVDARGTFETSITIPEGTPSGLHSIQAVSGEAQPHVDIQITDPPPVPGANASMMMVGVLRGESGCPNHPISSTVTDDTFMLFGSGFAPGEVTVHVDTPSGMLLGTAIVRADGSFCQQMRSVPRNAAGTHTLVAVENGAVAGQIPVTFVEPSVLH